MYKANNSTFEVTSGIIVASDPMYEIPTWCQGIINNVKKGTWLAEAVVANKGIYGNRVASLTVTHLSAETPLLFEEIDMSGGVDSGQFGFFDKDFYCNNEVAKDLPQHNFGTDGHEWYRACCKLTLDKPSWGTLPQGAVSSSGFGDGCYPVYGAKDANDEWVCFRVIFLDDEEENEE